METGLCEICAETNHCQRTTETAYSAVQGTLYEVLLDENEPISYERAVLRASDEDLRGAIWTLPIHLCEDWENSARNALFGVEEEEVRYGEGQSITRPAKPKCEDGILLRVAEFVVERLDIERQS